MSFKAYQVVLLMSSTAFLISCAQQYPSIQHGSTQQPPSGTTGVIQLVATADATSSTPGSYPIQQRVVVTLPQIQDFVVTANISEFYHTRLDVGSTSCDYIHQPGSQQLSSGAGCSTTSATTVVNPGETVSFSINPGGIHNFTAVNLTLMSTTLNN